MNKIGFVIAVVAIVVAVEVIMLLTMPVFVSLVSTANTTAAASSNMSNYPGAQDFLMATPWIMWFVPPAIGMIAIVVRLRKP